jgi:hypothetical protein
LAKKNKEIKGVILVVFFISIVLVSNIHFLSNSYLSNDSIFEEEGLEDLPISSDLNVDDFITGTGNDQDVRIYVNNESENLNNNQDYFEIPSVTSDDMYLSYGDFNFTFQNNFTTDYVLEDDDALFAEDFIMFDYDTGYSGISEYTNGTPISGGFNDLTDDSNSTYIQVDATQGVLNFTVRANFTGDTYTSGVINGNVEFNRSYILGLIYSLVFSLSKDTDLTVRLFDYSQSTWRELISILPINSSLGIQEIKDNVINENLNNIDLTNTAYIQFIFERGDSFTARLYECDIFSTYALDLPITDQEYVALEFDLKGESSAVNGFYAWIRTLDLAEAAISQLNITLYRANGTLVRTDNQLRTVKLSPDYNEMIDTQLISYNDDQLTYFSFNTANTQNLNLSNYFVVIKSTNSKNVYSLVSLPHFDYGDDGRTEHQLLTTIDSGVQWDFAKKVVESDNWPYTTGQLDASSFSLNVTRGYMPSDFSFNDNITLRIQNETINNLVIDSNPYNESSYLTWGLGRWNNNFQFAIEDTPANLFEVYLDWNRSIISGFSFNVSYSVKAFWIEGATAYYNATYNENPEWVFTFNFDNTNPNFNDWNFIEFWYVYPNFMSAHNLTNPNDEEFLWLLDEESVVAGSSSYLKLVINETFSSLNGIYTLNLTSFNFVNEMHSYINYYGSLIETNGFMYGDNVSISVDIQDHNSNAPISGDVNATLFYPNGTRYPGGEMISSSGFIDDTVLAYDFNNVTILDVTQDIPVLGEYELGFFWFNGSAIGCKKIILYIDSYELELYNCTYLPNLGTNALIGEFNNKVFENYTILIASINDTTGVSNPNFYPINNSDVNHEITYDFGGQELTLLIDSFLQSEDILNPNEIVNFKTTIQNAHPFIPLDVKINVKLVSFANNDLIIAQNTSSTINLNFSGTPDDSYAFDLNLAMPTLDIGTNTWEGYNAPVRLGGAKTIITLYIDDVEIGLYESEDYSLLSNKTSSNYEGHILGLKVNEEMTSRSLLYEFERDECLYFPDESSFLVNVIDKNYVSSYRQYDDKFTLNLNSIFTNITTTPEIPRTGEIINVSSVLTTEFGEELSGKNVTCEYYNTTTWKNIGSDLSDVNGSTTFLINTGLIEFDENLTIRLSWEGDIINGVTTNITIHFIQEINNFSIGISQNDNMIYMSRSTTITVSIYNFGESNLRFFNISVIITGDLSYSIVGINYLELNWLRPEEFTEIIIKIQIPEINSLEITFGITAQNIITSENITLSENASFLVFDPPLTDYFLEFFLPIMIIIFAVVWILAITYARKVMKRIEEPIEEGERKPKRGRYVMVSELKKPTQPKKAPKKKEAISTEKKTDLDSLLEERGLGEKEKKKSPKK